MVPKPFGIVEVFLYPLNTFAHELALRSSKLCCLQVNDDTSRELIMRHFLKVKVLRGFTVPSFLKRKEFVVLGAIPFVLSGADVMCPGLTSKGGSLSPAQIHDVVAITAEGKQHAMAVGKMILDSETIRTQNKGHGIKNLNVMCDGLWYLQDVLVS